tara:strand:+ start:2403 stop:2726 length:324 start_codon:yes stop_codon:yes gene_type:complete
MEDSGRYNHIEDVLVNLHDGQWFGWSDVNNKIYANLVIHDGSKDKPTEKSLTDALAKQQSDFDALDYARKREAEYPSIQECVHAILDDDLTALQKKRQAIKTKYPKS